MSAPSSDPPVTPPNGTSGNEKGEGSPAEATANGSAPPADPQNDDVKMDEVKPVEDPFDDIPEGVLSVSCYPRRDSLHRI